MFRWNPHCRIKLNPKPNRIYSTSSSFSSLLVQLLCLFLNDHFPLFLFNFCACFWMIIFLSSCSTSVLVFEWSFSSLLAQLLCLFLNDRVSFYFSYLGYDRDNTRVTRILCLCSSIVVCLLIWKRKQRWKKEWYQERKYMKGLSLGPYFLALLALHITSLAPKQIEFY